MTIENLAICLFEIHCKQLVPFYYKSELDKKKDNPMNWSELPEKSKVNSEINKDFFRTIAIDIIRESKKSSFENELPEKLYLIHSSHLAPYYISNDDYNKWIIDREEYLFRFNWKTLKEKTNKKNEVDKLFFKKMAKFLTSDLKINTPNTQ